jgi:translation initiation factor IF-1
MKLTIPALVSFAVVAAGSAAAQQATPTPVEQHVVAPSLPDQPNKEGVVRPSGSMPTDPEGYVRTNRGAIDPSSTSPAPGGAAAQGSATGSGAVRGTVKAYEKGVSITIVETDGHERTVKIAAKASVYEGLAAGDKVIVRIPLGKPADGKTTDHVEKQKSLKPPPKSKFAQAQSPAS